MSMDAGKFNFNKNVTGTGKQPSQTTSVGKSGPKESPSVQQDPAESVQLGNQPVLNEKTDKVSTGENEQKAPEVAKQSASSTGAIPSQVGDFLIAGAQSVGRPSNVSFGDLTAVNGINITSLHSVGGSTVASVNPLNPKSSSKPSTTSPGLVVSTFEDTQWITTSGRTISL